MSSITSRLGVVADKKQQKQGRPKMLPAELSERFNIRCSKTDLEKWTERAVALGYGSVSAWLRRVANESLKAKAA